MSDTHSEVHVEARWLQAGWARRVAGGLVASAGAALAIVAMGANPALGFGHVLGVVGCAAAVLGVLLLLPAPRGRAGILEVEAKALAGPVGQAALGVLMLLAALRAAVAGRVPGPRFVAGLVITASFLFCLHGALRGWRVLRASSVSPARRWFEHEGLWLTGLTAVLYLPALGAFGLIDPWETHYGEVAREMVARQDWISLWWAHQSWFWSKPVLAIWAQGLSFLALGVHCGADAMLSGIELGRQPAPEWAARLPFVLCALLGQYVLYVGARAHVGRRAACFGGLVAATCPYWYFLAHQSMVDMLYVAPVCAALGLLLLALRTDPNEPVSSYRLRFGPRWEVVLSGRDLLFAVVLGLVLPQAFYLISRNVQLLGEGGLTWVSDQLVAGSPGNCGLAGQPGCGLVGPSGSMALQPTQAALIWLLVLAALIGLEARQLGKQRLCYVGAWVCAALAFLGKGAPGLVLILFPFLAFVCVRGRFIELWRCRPLALVLLLGCVAAPWFVQAFERHGSPFIEELFIRDMFQRAFDHVHDTNKGDDTSFRYYVWQLGYGLFPWSGVAAIGTLVAIGRSLQGAAPSAHVAPAAHATGGSQDLIYFLVLYQLGAFGMFSIANTKFHHYIFPLVPAAALCGGLWLARTGRLVRESGASRASDREPAAGAPEREWASSAARLALLPLLGVASMAALLAGLQYLFGGSWSGAVGAPPEPLLGLALLLLGAGLGWVLHGRLARFVPPLAGSSNALALGWLAAAVVVGLAGRDLATTPAGGSPVGPARLLHLFTYIYTRPWPEDVDFRGSLAAITILAVVFSAAMIVVRLRRVLLALLGVLAIFSCGWALDVYFVRMAPHWGQRETIATYYRARASSAEPLVAYQMNWKGENFYTGNHLAIFVKTGRPFTQWLKAQRESGTAVVFFTTEHSRVSALQRELGSVKQLELLTDATLNNKFVLARVSL